MPDFLSATAVHFGTTDVQAVYRGSTLVWKKSPILGSGSGGGGTPTFNRSIAAPVLTAAAVTAGVDLTAVHPAAGSPWPSGAEFEVEESTDGGAHWAVIGGGWPVTQSTLSFTPSKHGPLQYRVRVIDGNSFGFWSTVASVTW